MSAGASASSGPAPIVPIAIEHAAGFHACLDAVAIRRYERVGFTHEAVMRRANRVNGVYYDALQMSLLLPPA